MNIFHDFNLFVLQFRNRQLKNAFVDCPLSDFDFDEIANQFEININHSEKGVVQSINDNDHYVQIFANFTQNDLLSLFQLHSDDVYHKHKRNIEQHENILWKSIICIENVPIKHKGENILIINYKPHQYKIKQIS